MNFLKQTNKMRKFRIILGFQLVLVFCTLQIFGQPVLNDSSQAYDYWSKRGIIEAVYAYMNDYMTTVTDSSLPPKSRKDCALEKTGLIRYQYQYIESISNLEIDELNQKFNQVSDFLKSNNWTGAEKNVFQPLLDNLNQKIKLNSDFFSAFKPTGNEKSTDIPGYSNKMGNWNNTVKKFLSSYNEDIRRLRKNQGSKPFDKSGTDKPSGGRESTDQVVTEKHDWLPIASISLLSFFVGVFLCYYLIRSRIYHIMGEDLEKYKDSIQESGFFAFISMVKLLKQRKNEYKNKVEGIENTNKKPKDENISVIHKSKDIDANVLIIEDTNKTVEWDIANDSNTRTGLFYTIPDSEGKFEVSDGKSENEGNCFYRIDNKPNSNQALLSYISNEKDKRAIENIENYLLPVCVIENFSDRRYASKVVMKDAGIVNLKYDSWVIDTNHKVKIKLV